MNRKTIDIAMYAILLCLWAGCTGRGEHYFNGEVRYLDDTVTARKVACKHLPLDGDNTGILSVYDSLLICWSPIYPDNFFNVFNVDTGKEIGLFCPKGQGANEAVSVNCIFQLFKRGTDLMTLLYASNEGKLFFWNISRSVGERTTVYDTIVPYDNYRIFFPFYQCEDTLLAYKPAEPLAAGKAATPLDFFFYTWDAMKPDGSKIVQVMRHIPQINIIDTRTGRVTGHRLKEGPDFSLLETECGSFGVL